MRFHAAREFVMIDRRKRTKITNDYKTPRKNAYLTHGGEAKASKQDEWLDGRELIFLI